MEADLVRRRPIRSVPPKMQHFGEGTVFYLKIFIFYLFCKFVFANVKYSTMRFFQLVQRSNRIKIEFCVKFQKQIIGSFLKKIEKKYFFGGKFLKQKIFKFFLKSQKYQDFDCLLKILAFKLLFLVTLLTF